MSNTIKILQGIPASGKSSWAREFCEKNHDWIRVNRDDLRHMRGKYHLPEQEELITSMERHCVGIALASERNVILDATNLNQRFLNEFLEYVEEMFPGTQIEYKFFEIDIYEAIRRDGLRPNPVGANVIKAMAKKLPKPTPVVYEGNENNPSAIIVDIDGTIALMTGRSPYDYTRVSEDRINPPVVDLVRRYWEDYEILLVSGRDGSCEEDTRRWLFDNQIPFDALWMRPAGNSEPDTVIKKRIFEEHIRDDYNVKFVLDDRKKVVDAWRRDLGLTVFQVAEGNF